MIRVLSGALLAAAALAAILLLPVTALRVLACVVAAGAAYELLRLLGRVDRATLAIVVAAVAVVCWGVVEPLNAWIVLTVGLALVGLDVVFRGRTLQAAAAALMAPVYIGMPLGMLAAVHARHGWSATLLLIGTVVASDSAQYYSGRAFGRHALAPAISPKKTVEGAVGGVAAGASVMVLAGSSVLPGATLAGLALLGAGLVALGICGDLFESRLKRIAGVKDSSALIPGHGGVLDRIDALLFATPAFFFSVQALA